MKKMRRIKKHLSVCNIMFSQSKRERQIVICRERVREREGKREGVRENEREIQRYPHNLEREAPAGNGWVYANIQ